MRKCLCVTIACIGVSLSSDVVCFEKRTPMKSFEDMFPMENFLLGFADYYCKEHNIQGPGLPIRITGTDVANYLDLDPEKRVYEIVEIMADNAIDLAYDYFDPRKKAIKKFWEFMGKKEYECFLKSIGVSPLAPIGAIASTILTQYTAFTSWIRFNSAEFDASDTVYKEFTKDGDIWGAIVADRYGDGCTLL